MRPISGAAVLLLVLGWLTAAASAEPWRRHTIDASSRGADGVRVGDINGDGLPDLTTGWEEGGRVRVYVNPGPQAAKQPWPAVTVGEVRSPEDAVFADLDGDGRSDVVSCCEGRERSVFVHWAPREEEKLLDPAAWRTEAIPAAEKQQMWMFALPMQIDGRNGVDLIVGSKGENASVSWLEAPADGRNLAGWRLHRLYDAGWIMSLAPHDVDDDGDQDVIVSDRKGKNRGVLWLENPGPEAAAKGDPWREHRIGGTGQEVMFLDVADLDRDGRSDVICATRNGHVLFLRRAGSSPDDWEEHRIENPHGAPGGKGVKAGDLDGDGRVDLVCTFELGNDRSRPGAAWMTYRDSPTDATWQTRDIAGSEGLKFDLIQLLDLDADGDLDVLTCEERDNLGVFWYENPGAG
jgi:hypothetical protein